MLASSAGSVPASQLLVAAGDSGLLCVELTSFWGHTETVVSLPSGLLKEREREKLRVPDMGEQEKDEGQGERGLEGKCRFSGEM